MTKPLHSDQYRLLVQRLRNTREQLGVTQAKLAVALGEGQTFVSKCETGVRRLDVIELRAWLSALGIAMPEFIQELEADLQALAARRRDPAQSKEAG